MIREIMLLFTGVCIPPDRQRHVMEDVARAAQGLIIAAAKGSTRMRKLYRVKLRQ